MLGDKFLLKNAFYQYREDFGLGRTALLILSYTILYFLVTAIWVKPLWYLLVPVMICLILLFFRQRILESGSLTKFLSNIPIPFSFALFGYISVGDIDRHFNKLKRMDDLAIAFDSLFSAKPIALVFEELMHPFPLLKVIFYDLLMISYFLYFLVPFVGGILLYRQFSHKLKHKIGQFVFAIALFYMINYLFYILVPITGPQYYQADLFQSTLPFSPLGELLSSIIQRYHYTLIDCFPSGHFGICFLVTLFLYRYNNIGYFILGLICFFVLLATLALRYHYMFDLFFSLFLVYFVFKVSEILYPINFCVSLFREE